MAKKSIRAKTSITYHGRTGKPKLHWTGVGRPFIMVRAKGGGVKRLYLDTKTAKSNVTKGYESLKKEAKKRKR